MPSPSARSWIWSILFAFSVVTVVLIWTPTPWRLAILMPAIDWSKQPFSPRNASCSSAVGKSIDTLMRGILCSAILAAISSVIIVAFVPMTGIAPFSWQ